MNFKFDTRKIVVSLSFAMHVIRLRSFGFHSRLSVWKKQTVFLFFNMEKLGWFEHSSEYIIQVNTQMNTGWMVHVLDLEKKCFFLKWIKCLIFLNEIQNWKIEMNKWINEQKRFCLDHPKVYYKIQTRWERTDENGIQKTRAHTHTSTLAQIKPWAIDKCIFLYNVMRIILLSVWSMCVCCLSQWKSSQLLSFCLL